MKSMKKLLSCALALTIAAGMFAVPAAADDEQATEEVTAAVEAVEEVPETDSVDPDENGFVIENGILKSYKGTATDIVIPAGVTGIGEYAFEDSVITSVVFPDGVKTIKRRAFWKCKYLKKIEMPDSVTYIGGAAFMGCIGLLEAKLSAGLTDVGSEPDYGSGVFSGCSSLRSIVIPDSLSVITTNMFLDCTSLTSVTLGSSVKTIDTSAFEGCSSLNSIVVPGNVKTIGKCAFKNCINLVSVNLKDGIEFIGNSCFNNCKLIKSIVIPGSVKEIGEYAFSDLVRLTDIKLSFGIETIGQQAFQNTGISSIDIPDSVTYIAAAAFANCTNLSSVHLGTGLKRLYGNSYNSLCGPFEYCDKITSIHLPDATKEFDYALRRMPNLTELTIGTGMVYITDTTLSGLDALKTLTFTTGTSDINKKAFSKNQLPALTTLNYTGTMDDFLDLISLPAESQILETYKTYNIFCSDGVIVSGAKQEATVTALTLTAPVRTVYNQYDKLDMYGGSVSVTYSNGMSTKMGMTTPLITDAAYATDVVGKKKLEVKYGTGSAEYEITVEGAPVVKTLSSITVTPPTKLTYNIGEALDVTGGVVNLVYSDQSTGSVPLTLDMCSGFDSSKAGTKTVTVTYEGKTATFKVTVKKGETPVDPTQSGVTLNGEPVASYEAAINAIGKNPGDFTITISKPVTVAKFAFPKNAKLAIVATENGSITTAATSLAPSAPLTLECPITNSKGKDIAINAKSDLTLTGGTFGNVSVGGKATLTGVAINGNLALKAKADNTGATSDTLENVTVAKKVTSNNNVNFIDCKSIGTVAVKGGVKIIGESTKAVQITANGKNAVSELENVTVDKKVAIAGKLIADGLSAGNAVDVKGDANISDSTITGKLSVKGQLTVNGDVLCKNAVSCAELNSDEGANLTYQSLAVTKNGITNNSADITVKVIDKNGVAVKCEVGKKTAVVVKSFKVQKGTTPDISRLKLDPACGTGTLRFEKNKIVFAQ